MSQNKSLSNSRDKIIRSLKKEGRLRRIGPDKDGHWEVGNKGT